MALATLHFYYSVQVQTCTALHVITHVITHAQAMMYFVQIHRTI